MDGDFWGYDRTTKWDLSGIFFLAPNKMPKRVEPEHPSSRKTLRLKTHNTVMIPEIYWGVSINGGSPQ